MTRSTTDVKLAMQVVLQGEACELGDHLDRNHIAYVTLSQPGPTTLRVAAADWQSIRTIATALGYGRPEFVGEPETVGVDPFQGYWVLQAAEAHRC
jgi:hypothetical protein